MVKTSLQIRIGFYLSTCSKHESDSLSTYLSLLSIFDGLIKHAWRRAKAVQLVFETSAQVKIEAN
jgi:hypothetical protein